MTFSKRVNQIVGKLGWYYHDQDLREDRGAWFDWRGWLYSHPDKGSPFLEYQVCVLPRWKHWSAEIEIGQRSIKPHISTPLFSLYLTFRGLLEHLPMEKLLPGEQMPNMLYTPQGPVQQPGTHKMVEKAVTGVSFDTEMGWSLRWQLWHPTMSWHSTTPKWRYGSIEIKDLIFGKQKYTSKKTWPVYVEVPMPEGVYEGLVTMHLDTWKRPRWFPERIQRATIDVERPPQHAGKGENSWDLDDDGIWSMTCPADDVQDAVGKYVASALRNRAKYGPPRDHQLLQHREVL